MLTRTKFLLSVPRRSFNNTNSNTTGIPQPLETLNGPKFIGITPDSSRTLLELLDQNNQNLDIFYNTNKLYHNHLAHHLLASYSLGGSAASLKRIYNNYAAYIPPREKSHTKITHKNWLENLGNKDLYIDYFNFFNDMINTNSMQQCFDIYAMHPQIFRRLFSGAFHPLIHVGYGVEFNIPLILSEGLADAAVHPDYFADLLDDSYFASRQKGNKKILDIVEEIQRDPTFDGLANAETPYHVASMKLASKIDIIKEYANSWAIPKNRGGLESGIKELYDACALLYGATAIRPDKESIRLDFFILHGLTAMLFTQIMQPFMVHERRIRLVRGTLKLFGFPYIHIFKAHLAVLLTTYIARGRPKLHTEMLYEYKPKELEVEPNSWLDVVREALKEEDEAHLIKVVRALMRAEQFWGADEKNTYLKVAQLSVEGYKKYKFAELGGTGWDENW